MDVENEGHLAASIGGSVRRYSAWRAFHVRDTYLGLLGRHRTGKLDNPVDAVVGEFLQVVRFPVVPRISDRSIMMPSSQTAVPAEL
jgi:hypothetical protein